MKIYPTYFSYEAFNLTVSTHTLPSSLVCIYTELYLHV